MGANQDYEIPGLEDIEDLQDDPPAEDPKPEEPKGNTYTQEYVDRIIDRAERAENGYREIKSKQDQLVDRYGKVAINVVKAGVGDYNEETGEISIALKKEEANLEQKLEDLNSKIKTEKQTLRKQYNEGELTFEEYQDAMDEKVDSLIEQRNELKLEIKLNAGKQKDVPQEPQAKDLDLNKNDSLAKQFRSLQREFPDSDKPDSELFKAMQEVMETDDSFNLDDINYGDMENGKITRYTGNPEERKRLIQKAQDLIATRTKDNQKKEQKGNADKFGGPEGAMFTPAPTKDGLDKHQVNGLVASGIKDKSLIKEINGIYNSFLNTGSVILEG